MPRKFYKHKLIFDEGFHLRHKLPITNSRFNIKHVAANYKQSGLPDPDVYELARKEGRLLVTYNIKDFTKLITQPHDPGIIGISPNISLEQIDKKLTALLTRSGKNDLMGKLTSINEELKNK